MSTLRTDTLQTTDSAYSIQVSDLASLASVATSSTRFGTVGNGFADDTVALNNFLAASDVGYIPPGQYKITGTLNFRSGQVITGAGPATTIIYQAVAPAANTPVLSMVNLTNTSASGFQVKVDTTTYPTARTLYTSGCSDCVYKDILLTGAGANASYTQNSTRCVVRNVKVDKYLSNGFYVNGGKFNVVDGVSIPDGSFGFMGVQLVGGVSNVVKNCYIAKTPDNYFGIHAFSCDFADLHSNTIENTRREALAVGGNCHGVRVHNNTFSWTENLGVGDFGMSLAGDNASTIVADFEVYGNTIMNSALDGIGVAGWTQRGKVFGNIIRDCCQMGSVGHQSGIKLYGWIAGAVVEEVVVSENLISKVTGGGMLFGVSETNSLGVANNNTIRNNRTVGLGGGLNVYNKEATTSVIALNHDDLNLKPHAAPLLSTSGTVSSSSATLYFQTMGKHVVCTLIGSITNNGTGSGQLTITLPFTILSGQLSGAETAVNGKACKAGIAGGGNQLAITNYDNTYPGVNGATFSLSGILRIA